MPSEAAAGSQTAVISTEHSLSIQTSGGVYQALVSLENLTYGDIVEIRVYVKARAAESTRKQAWHGEYSNPHPFPLVVTIPLAATNWEVTLKQTAGTGRAFPWSVLSI